MQSAKDRAIVDAICELDESVLTEQRKRPDLASLISDVMAENFAAADSHDDAADS